jgi:hypothetical protein
MNGVDRSGQAVSVDKSGQTKPMVDMRGWSKGQKRGFVARMLNKTCGHTLAETAEILGTSKTTVHRLIQIKPPSSLDPEQRESA